jgi:short-subunit dehydrogenase
MRSALVTGASSGIGEAIRDRLLTLGYEVHGISRGDFTLKNKNYHHHKIDLSKEFTPPVIKNLHILVNCAGVGYFAPCEEIGKREIEEMVYLNLTAPLLLTREYLRSLKKNGGYIFNINSTSAIEPAIFGAVYGATKAGLRHFGSSLFKEARKSGLKVVNINPDITDTNFFKNLRFGPTSDPITYIEPKDIAGIIEDILNLRDGSVVTDVTIEPQKFQLDKKRVEK